MPRTSAPINLFGFYRRAQALYYSGYATDAVEFYPPTGQRWFVFEARFVYTCTAVAGTRTIQVQWMRGARITGVLGGKQLTAGQVWRATFLPSPAQIGALYITDDYLPLPSPCILEYQQGWDFLISGYDLDDTYTMSIGVTIAP